MRHSHSFLGEKSTYRGILLGRRKVVGKDA